MKFFDPTIVIHGLSEVEDTLLLSSLLQTIKENIQAGKKAIFLECKNAGTVIRFLTALLAATPGN
jgi:5-enolpyruvylshikimate-3-phosphate synthase